MIRSTTLLFSEFVGMSFGIAATKYVAESLKNITRYLGTKEKFSLVPYNVLFYEAAEEATVPDLFLRLRKLNDSNDNNYFFVKETLDLTNRIVARIKELQMLSCILV